jgi:type III secretory pathway component EscT
MPDQPENKPQLTRQRSILIAFLLAGIGIVLLNEAADSLHVHALNGLVVLQLAFGIICLVLALLWGRKRS